MGLDDEVAKVEGDEPGKNYIIRIAGEVGLASRRATKLLGLAKSEKGWRVFSVRDLEATGAKTRIYMDADKSKKTKRRALIGRRLGKAIRDDFGSKGFYYQKETGIVAMHFVPIASHHRGRARLHDRVEYAGLPREGDRDSEVHEHRQELPWHA